MFRQHEGKGVRRRGLTGRRQRRSAARPAATPMIPRHGTRQAGISRPPPQRAAVLSVQHEGAAEDRIGRRPRSACPPGYKLTDQGQLGNEAFVIMERHGHREAQRQEGRHPRAGRRRRRALAARPRPPHRHGHRRQRRARCSSIDQRSFMPVLDDVPALSHKLLAQPGGPHPRLRPPVLRLSRPALRRPSPPLPLRRAPSVRFSAP